MQPLTLGQQKAQQLVCFGRYWEAPGRSDTLQSRTEFLDVVLNIWFPICICDGEHKPTTVAFNKHISNTIADYFSGKAIQTLSGTDIQKYLIQFLTIFCNTVISIDLSSGTSKSTLIRAKKIQKYRSITMD